MADKILFATGNMYTQIAGKSHSFICSLFIEERKQSKFSLIAYDFSAKQVYSCGIKWILLFKEKWAMIQEFGLQITVHYSPVLPHH